MSLIPFASVEDFSTVLSVGALAKGMNGTLFFDALPGHANLFVGPSGMRQSYSVKPQGMNATVSGTDKFEINLQVGGTEADEFVGAVSRFDRFLLASVFARKGEVLPKKASVINSVDALAILYHSGRLIKSGAQDKNGGFYPDNFRLKITGEWGSHVSQAHTKVVQVKGQEKTVVDYCDWKERTKALAPNETRFYMWVRTEGGKDVYADRLPSETGVGTRLVGPQDCVPGCSVTPVFSLSHVYVGEGVGVTATARVLYIRPGAAREEEGGDSSSPSFSAATIPMLGGAVLEGDAAAHAPLNTTRKRASTDADAATAKKSKQ